MCHRADMRLTQQQGMSLVEVMISLALLLMLSVIAVGGMTVHARTARSNIVREQLGENSRRLVTAAQLAALDSTIMRVDTGPAGAATVLTLGKPDPNNSGNVLFKQFAYLDGDNNPATIKDNIIVQRDEDAADKTTGKLVVQYCSIVGTKKIFEEATNTARPLININVRVGDRTMPPNNTDNALTGPGYQSFLIAASVSQL